MNYKIPSLLIRKLTSSLFFMPLVTVFVSVLAALVLLDWKPLGGAQLVSSDGFRSFVTTVAQAMMSLAGVTFSVVVVALTLASNQFCPRVLRHFVEDRWSRIFISTLVGDFSFTLTLVALLEDGDRPDLSLVLACSLYTMVATGLFIYFVHHLATTLQVEHIISMVESQTYTQIRRVKNSERPRLLGPASPHDLTAQPNAGVKAVNTGYILAVDYEVLLKVSAALGVPAHLLAGEGDWINPGLPLVDFPGAQLSDAQTAKIQRAFELDRQRYLVEDVSLGFRELTDIALKAISPAINDPTTAVACLDRVGGLLVELLNGGWPPCELEQDKGVVKTDRNLLGDYLHLCCDQILRCGQGMPQVLLAVRRLVNIVAFHPEARHSKAQVEEWSRLVERSLCQCKILDSPVALP